MAKKVFNNKTLNVKRFSKNKNLFQNYDGESLKSILTEIPFEMVNIPLYSYKKLLLDNGEGNGNQVVGYLYKYDKNTDTFECVIHEKYVEKISGFDKPIIFPRTLLIGDKVTRILGFDICPELYYAVLK